MCVTETPQNKSGTSDETTTGRAASSPFDGPTERLPIAYPQMPQTDEDLDIDATSQLPPYRSDFEEPAQKYAFEPETPPPPPAVPLTKAKRAPARTFGDEAKTNRGTLDLGLLILRLTVGGIFVYHGLQKLTGWWGGPGLDGMERGLASGGWSQPRLSAIMVTIGELAGGSLLIIGLATPLAGGAVLAVIIDAWLVKQNMQHGLQFTTTGADGKTITPSPEYETVLMLAAAAIILTGPGKYAFDGGRGWATRPYIGSLLALLAAIAAAACTWIFLHGGNPFI